MDAAAATAALPKTINRSTETAALSINTYYLWKAEYCKATMAKQRSGLLLGGFLVGAAVGTVAGLLFAPRTGRETRQLLKKSADTLPELAEDLSTSLQFQADRLSESAVHQWEETLVRLREALRAGVEAANAQRLPSQGQESQEKAR